jgi:hypothetical protein
MMGVVKRLCPILGVLVLVGSACASSAKEEVPQWLKDNAHALKARLRDPDATISYVLGSHPIAVVHGRLTCSGPCIGPVPYPGTGVSVTGSTAAERYDGRTHESTDFTVMKTGPAETVRSLCETHGSRCASGGPPG